MYSLTITGADESAGYTGDLNITNGYLLILGQNHSGVTIDATNLGDRVFNIQNGARLMLDNLIITGGAAISSPRYVRNVGFDLSGESGGAIYNSGELILQDCNVSGNSSGNGISNGGDGGGIYNIGNMKLINSIVSGNVCGSGGMGGKSGFYNGRGGNGGGIYNDGKMTVESCLINGNTAGFDIISKFNFEFYGGNGGGIYNSSTLNLNDCTISDNTAGKGGDGEIWSPKGWPGGNGGNGGGICNIGTLIARNCLITRNSGGSGGTGGTTLVFSGASQIGGTGGNGGNGGGIYNEAPASQTKLIETKVVSNMTGAGGEGGIYIIFSGGPSSSNIIGGITGSSGLAGSYPNLFGDFTILRR